MEWNGAGVVERVCRLQRNGREVQRNGSEWVRVGQSGPEWARMDQNGPEWAARCRLVSVVLVAGGSRISKRYLTKHPQPHCRTALAQQSGQSLPI